MTDEELIKFLRTSTNSCFNKTSADRIEALVRERDAAIASMEASAIKRGQAEARAERLEAALQSIESDANHGVMTSTYSETSLRSILKGIRDRARAALEGEQHDQL